MAHAYGRSLAFLTVVVLFAGCGKDSLPGGGGGLTPVGAISLVPATATMQVGDTLIVSASISAADGGTLVGVAPAWSSSNTTIAAVDQSGKVAALAVGTVDIAAAAEGVSGVAHLTVVAHTIKLSLTVTGNGTVTSAPGGIACDADGGTCSAIFSPGTSVVLTEVAGTGEQFGGWVGGCLGSAATCPLVLTGDVSITAQFGSFHTLTFTTTGNGSVSADGGAVQKCAAASGVCSGMYLIGSQVVLSGAPNAGAALSAWSGACASATGNTCTVTMSDDLTAGATFSDVSTLSAMSGGGQTAIIDAQLPEPIIIHVVDANGGAAVQGAVVTLSGPPGAAVTPATAATDSQGNATFYARLSRTVGAQTFTATTMTSAAPITVSATATAPTAGMIFTLVDTSHNSGFDGFPGAATTAHLASPSGLALAADGTLYIADYGNHSVFALTPAGVLSKIAGTGTCGTSGDGGAATAAQLCHPLDLALDESSGQRMLYIADYDAGLVRTIDLTLSTPQITTFAGGGSPAGPGFGDGAPATQASLSQPARISLGPDGYLYIADQGHDRIRRVSLSTKNIENWLTGDSAFCRFNTCAVSWDANGTPFITRNITLYDFAIYRVNADLSLSLVAGGDNNATDSADDGIQAPLAQLFAPAPVRFDAAGNLLITQPGTGGASPGQNVRRVDEVNGQIETLAGTGTAGYAGDYTAATGAELYQPWTSVLDASGNLYIADSANSAVRVIWGAGQSTKAVATLAKTDGDLQMVPVDQITPQMQVSLLDPGGQPITGYPVSWQSIDPGGVIFAGTVDTDLTGHAAADGRVGLNSGGTWHYTASAVDLHGQPVTGSPVTFADTSNDLPDDFFFTILNTSHMQAFTGFPGAATAAQVPYPESVLFGSDGTLYVSASQDSYTTAIFTISPAGALTRIAGTGTCGYTGDDGPALDAEICNPTDMQLDETHQRKTLYLNDTLHAVIRAIDLTATPPTIHTLAGGGSATTSPYGDGALATEATLADPEHITLDPAGTFLYVSSYDGGNRTGIRRIDLSSGIINTWIPSSWFPQLSGAGCAQSACKLAFSAPDATHPHGTACLVTGQGSYVYALWKLDESTTPFTFTMIAGTNQQFQMTADGKAIGNYFQPGDLRFGPDGKLYLTDPYSNRVRVMSDLSTSATLTTVAGTGNTTPSNGADGPAATSVGLGRPSSLAFAPDGSLVIADPSNFTVREIWKLVP